MALEPTSNGEATDLVFVASPLLAVGKLAGTLAVIAVSALFGRAMLEEGMHAGGIPTWSPYFLAVVAIGAFLVVGASSWLWYRFVRLEVRPGAVEFRYPVTWAGTGRGGLIIAGLAVIIIGVTASPPIWFALAIGVLSLVMAVGRGVDQFLVRRRGGGYDLKTSVSGVIPCENLRNARRWPSPVGRALGYGSIAIGYVDETGREGALLLHGLSDVEAAVVAVGRIIPDAPDRPMKESQDSP